MRKTGWCLAVAAALISAASATSFAWEKGTHAYIADLLRKKAGVPNIEEIYGAMAPDMFNYLFENPVLAFQAWLYEQTHYNFMKVWDAARTGGEKSAAAGFLSHNNVWGADVTAHTASLTLDPGEGYVITKAKMLHAILMTDPGYAALFGSEEAQAVALEICHNFIEAAGDVILKRNAPKIGRKLMAIASRPKTNIRRLTIKAYADDLSQFSASTSYPLTPKEAAGLIRRVENEFRRGIIGYGYLLQGDEAVFIENIVVEFCSLAEAFLAAYGFPVPPEETLIALISAGISIGIDLCAADYMTEVNATVDFVAAQLASHGIK